MRIRSWWLTEHDEAGLGEGADGLAHQTAHLRPKTGRVASAGYGQGRVRWLWLSSVPTRNVKNEGSKVMWQSHAVRTCTRKSMLRTEDMALISSRPCRKPRSLPAWWETRQTSIAWACRREGRRGRGGE